MSFSFITHTQDLLDHFRELDSSAHSEIVSFYETHKKSLSGLDTESFLEIELGYANALFELGKYEHFLTVVQYLLESLIFNNIKYLKGEDIYQKLLLRKAAAHYHLLEFVSSERVLWELLHINPEHHAASYLLKRCLIKSEPSYLIKVKGLSIVLFLLSALIISIELLLIRPFFEEYSSTVTIVRNTLFVLAIFAIIFSDAYHRLQTLSRVNKRIAEIKSRPKFS